MNQPLRRMFAKCSLTVTGEIKSCCATSSTDFPLLTMTKMSFSGTGAVLTSRILSARQRNRSGGGCPIAGGCSTRSLTQT